MSDNQQKSPNDLSDEEKKQVADGMPLSEVEDLAEGESKDDETELPDEVDDVEENMFPDAE